MRLDISARALVALSAAPLPPVRQRAFQFLLTVELQLKYRLPSNTEVTLTPALRAGATDPLFDCGEDVDDEPSIPALMLNALLKVLALYCSLVGQHLSVC